MRSTRTVLAAAVAAAALLLTGCGGTPSGSATDADPAATTDELLQRLGLDRP